MTFKNNHPNLCLKFNNLTTGDPCGICGGSCQPNEKVTYNLFLEGTRVLVCDTCGWQHARALMYVLGLMGGRVGDETESGGPIYAA